MHISTRIRAVKHAVRPTPGTKRSDEHRLGLSLHYERQRSYRKPGIMCTPPMQPRRIVQADNFHYFIVLTTHLRGDERLLRMKMPYSPVHAANNHWDRAVTNAVPILRQLTACRRKCAVMACHAPADRQRCANKSGVRTLGQRPSP